MRSSSERSKRTRRRLASSLSSNRLHPRHLSGAPTRSSSSSDEYEESEATSSSVSSPPTSPRSSTPRYTTSSPVSLSDSRGLPLHLQKQLLQQIEKEPGGLKHLKLKSLCDRFPQAYGARGSKLREKVQNKVDRWKRLDKNSYGCLLIKLGVDPTTTEASSPAPTNPTSPSRLPRHQKSPSFQPRTPATPLSPSSPPGSFSMTSNISFDGQLGGDYGIANIGKNGFNLADCCVCFANSFVLFPSLLQRVFQSLKLIFNIPN